MFKKILGLSLAVGMLLNAIAFAASEQHSWVDDIARSNEVYNAYVCENCGEVRHEEIAKIRNYVITLDASGGIAEPAQLTTKNGKVTLPIPANSSDYLFEGWYDENGTLVTPDRVFEEDTTLYARWSTDSTYTLYFASDGGSRIKPITGAYGTTVSLTGYIPVKNGYVFEGWYADPRDKQQRITDFTFYEHDVVYAKWRSIGANTAEETKQSTLTDAEVMQYGQYVDEKTGVNVTELWVQQQERLKQLMEIHNSIYGE